MRLTGKSRYLARPGGAGRPAAVRAPGGANRPKLGPFCRRFLVDLSSMGSGREGSSDNRRIVGMGCQALDDCSFSASPHIKFIAIDALKRPACRKLGQIVRLRAGCGCCDFRRVVSEPRSGQELPQAGGHERPWTGVAKRRCQMDEVSGLSSAGQPGCTTDPGRQPLGNGKSHGRCS